jgi:hypothetical protein
LTLSASDITLKNAQISAQSFGNVNASDILVQFSGQMVLDPSSIATSANLGNGGSITIRGGQSLFLDNSSITTSVGGAAGNGGDITIATGALASNTGFVQANTLAEGGVGGLVNIEAGALLASGNYLLIGGTHPYTFDPGVFGVNVIQAAAPDGLSGTIDLSTPQLDIAGLLESLKAPPPTPSPVGKNPCQFAGGSSFTLAGTGGMALSPTDMLRAPEAIDPTDRDDAKHPGGSSSRKATPVRCHS